MKRYDQPALDFTQNVVSINGAEQHGPLHLIPSVVARDLAGVTLADTVGLAPVVDAMPVDVNPVTHEMLKYRPSVREMQDLRGSMSPAAIANQIEVNHRGAAEVRAILGGLQ